MSGHSKWKTIQHKKGAADAKRGKMFSKYSKELTVAARMGGGDPEFNPTLRTIISNARAANMPVDNIDRAIKKGTGELEGSTLEEVTYEGYGAGGVGIVVKVLTDNKNRAAAEIRFVFTRNNSAFAGQGSVSRNFQRKGQILIDEDTVAEDKLMELILEAGAEDMTHEDGQYEVLTDPAAFNDVLTAIQKADIKTESAQISLIPTLWMTVNEASAARSVMRFVEGLEDLDDVQDVYTNLDVPENILKELGQED